jgi:hypothetical protein
MMGWNLKKLIGRPGKLAREAGNSDIFTWYFAFLVLSPKQDKTTNPTEEARILGICARKWLNSARSDRKKPRQALSFRHRLK